MTRSLLQVIWWLNLGCLGLYVLVVLCSAVCLQRGVYMSDHGKGKLAAGESVACFPCLEL
ncbi:hypothetical protein FKM82_019067 [Ascaphus truei]